MSEALHEVQGRTRADGRTDAARVEQDLRAARPAARTAVARSGRGGSPASGRCGAQGRSCPSASAPARALRPPTYLRGLVGRDMSALMMSVAVANGLFVSAPLCSGPRFGGTKEENRQVRADFYGLEMGLLPRPREGPGGSHSPHFHHIGPVFPGGLLPASCRAASPVRATGAHRY